MSANYTVIFYMQSRLTSNSLLGKVLRLTVLSIKLFDRTMTEHFPLKELAIKYVLETNEIERDLGPIL